MKRNPHTTHATLWLALAALVLIAQVIAGRGIIRVSAQSGGGYDLTWNTMDGGGGVSSGGSYTLSGTLGQPDAGAQTGGSYTLTGGFWAALNQLRLYLPTIFK